MALPCSRPVAFALVLGGAASAMPSRASAAEPYCETNAAAIYCNNFEDGSLDGLEPGPRATVVTAAEGAPIFDGDGVLQADFSPPYGADAEFGHRFAGVEQLWVRFYVRFDASWDEPMHHFYAIHGDRTDDMWSCHGDAGCRPNGVLCLSGTTVDTRELVRGQLPGQPFFYTYHPAMMCDSGESCANYADPQAICDGCAAKGLPCESGLECCWGENLDIDDASLSLVGDTWYAVETMVRANTPGRADGEMALWIDGTLVGQRSGIAWREDPGLLLNHFIVWNYYPESTAAHHIWFDNLVISAAPIGTLDEPAPPGTGGADDGPTTGAEGTTGADGGGNEGVDGADAADGATGQPGDGGGSGASSGPGANDSADGEGCSCRDGGHPGSGSLLLLLWFARRRRASP
jgi:hypothetical protein